jgi:hypothetical protein
MDQAIKKLTMKKFTIIPIAIFLSVMVFGQSNEEPCITCDGNRIDFTKRASAIGTRNESTGINSFSAGYLSESTGNYSFSFGLNNYVSGESSAAFGIENRAEGKCSFAMGWKSQSLLPFNLTRQR